MRVADLEGESLDLWVAKAEGYAFTEVHEDIGHAVIGTGPAVLYWAEPGNLGLACKGGGGYWRPSTDWAQSGPIIERERVGVFEGAIWPTPGNPPEKWIWYACVGGSPNYGASLESPDFHQMSGPTPLIASMRAYVASKFGEEVPDSAG